MIRRATHQPSMLFDDHELIVDNFAGGGGASIGICPPVVEALVAANVPGPCEVEPEGQEVAA